MTPTTHPPSVRLRRVQTAAALSLLAVVVVLATDLGGPRGAMVVTDVSSVLMAAFAAVACLAAGRRSHDRARGFWLLLGTGCVSWAIAEATWGVYELVLDQPVPAPSWADVGYLVAVPIVVAGLLIHPAAPISRAARGRSALDALSVATAVGFLAWTFVVGPLWRESDLSTAAGLVAVAYPFTDVVLIVLVVLTITRADAAHRASLMWVLAGLAAMALVDSGYTLLAQTGQYQSGDMIDIGWLVGYLALGVGAYASHPATDPATDAATPVESASVADAPSLLAAVAPFLPVLLALGATPLVVGTEAGLDGAARTMALGLTLLVVARQGLHLYDRRPGRSREAVA